MMLTQVSHDRFSLNTVWAKFITPSSQDKAGFRPPSSETRPQHLCLRGSFKVTASGGSFKAGSSRQSGEQGREPELRFVAIPCKAAQGPQVNLFLFPPHPPTAAIPTAWPMGRQHSSQQPLSYSFTRAVPSIQVSSLPSNPRGCLPASSISAVTSWIDSTQKTCSCRSGATKHWQPDGLRAQKMLKLSSKAAGKSP